MGTFFKQNYFVILKNTSVLSMFKCRVEFERNYILNKAKAADNLILTKH